MSPGPSAKTAFRQFMLQALNQGGYTYSARLPAKHGLGNGQFRADAVVEKDGRSFLVSLHWADTPENARRKEKIAYALLCSADAVHTGECDRAYLLLGGDGWDENDPLLNGELLRCLRNVENVRIFKALDFTALARRGKL